MLKGEIAILNSVLFYKGNVKQFITPRVARHSPFFFITLNNLMDKGYIICNKPKGYQITDKGIRVLAEFYPKNPELKKTIQTRLMRRQSSDINKAIKMMEQLKSDYYLFINHLQRLKGDMVDFHYDRIVLILSEN